MKLSRWGIMGLGFALSAQLMQAAPMEKPNILFIFADDLSYETIRAHGLLDIDTPHLDTLVEQGTSFTHAYNMGAYNGAVCVASRAMLNTGRFVWNAYQHDTSTKMREEAAGGRMWSQLMQKAGYRTYMTGKWHVKGDPEDIFDVAANKRPGMPRDLRKKNLKKNSSKPVDFGYSRPVDEEDYKNGWKPWDTTNGGYWEGGKHWSEVVADDGIAFLKDAKNQDKPFFMYLAFNAAHDPRQAPKEYVDRYPLDRIELPTNYLPEYPHAGAICGKTLRDEKLMPYPRTEYSVKVNRQEYFALITHMDDQIGRIIQALEKSGQADNTYIVFTADHGLAVGRHGLAGKQNMYDHSVRVPFMIVGPNIKKGEKNAAPIYLQDIMPTALELAGAPLPDYVDFKSLMPMLQGKTDKSYDRIYGAYMGKQRMITQDGWKLIHYPTIGVDRLYNMKADPFETNDLANNPEYAAKLKELKADLLKLSVEMNDPLDYDNPVESWKKSSPSKKKK